MTPTATTQQRQAFTLIELLVVAAIILIILITAMPTLKGAKVKKNEVQCLNNLRQVVMSYTLWASDHTNLYPWEVSTNAGGSQERIEHGRAVDQFLPLATYLPNPAILVCPADHGRSARNFYFGLDNTNLSYFISLDATITTTPNPATLIIAGDRHLTYSNQPVGPGIFVSTNFAVLGWQSGFHTNSNQSGGTLAFADGHCEYVRAESLPSIFQRQGLTTNRLLLP